MSGFASWNASASAWNSGVVSMLQPERLSVTGPEDSSGAAASSPPPLQPARASVATTAMPAAAAYERFILGVLLCDCGPVLGPIGLPVRGGSGVCEATRGRRSVRPDDRGGGLVAVLVEDDLCGIGGRCEICGGQLQERRAPRARLDRERH